MKVIPSLKEIAAKGTPAQVEDLFIKKVQAAAIIFDFSNDNNRYLEEKDIKRKTLLEII